MSLTQLNRFREVRADGSRSSQEEICFDAAFRKNLEGLLHWRRDVRHFRSEALPEGMLDELLQLVCDTAPSVGNSQPWRFVRPETTPARTAVIRNFEEANAEALAAQAEDRKALYASLKLEGLRQAPEQIAVFCDEGTSQGHGLGQATMPETRRYSVVMAIHALWLLLRTRGIGMGWVSILEPERLKQDLDVPDSWSFVGYLCIGYPQRESRVADLEEAGWQARRPTKGIFHRR